MAGLTFAGQPGITPMDPNAFTQYMVLGDGAQYSMGMPGQATAASTMGAAMPTGGATATGGAAGASMAPVVQPPAPNGPAGGGGFLQGLGGWNIDTARLALGGIQTLGNILMGARALRMAKDQFNYQKGVSETNLVNSIQAYNTALTDRANNRGDAMNQDQATTDAYIEANKARRV